MAEDVEEDQGDRNASVWQTQEQYDVQNSASENPADSYGQDFGLEESSMQEIEQSSSHPEVITSGSRHTDLLSKLYKQGTAQ